MKGVSTVTKACSAFTQVWGLAPASPSSVVEGLQIQRLERAFVNDKNPVTGYFSEQRSYTDGCCSCDGLSIQENHGLYKEIIFLLVQMIKRLGKELASFQVCET